MNRCITNLIIVLYALLPLNGKNGIRSDENDVVSPIESGHTYCFCEDEDGFVWFGMLGEIVRYDGLRIQRFPIPGNTAATLRPNAIVPLGNSTLLLGGDFGLEAFDTRQRQFREKIDADNNPVYSMIKLNDDKALIGRARGLMIADRNLSLDTVAVPLSVNNLSVAVYDMARSANGTLWITTNYGIYSATPGDDGNLSLTHRAGGAHDRFSRIAATDSCVYAFNSGNDVRDRGVYVYDIGRNNWRLLDDINHMVVASLDITNDHLHVVADGDGIRVYDNKTNNLIDKINRLSSPRNISSNSVYSSFTDSHHNFYVGLYNDGVEVLVPRHHSLFDTYIDDNGLNTDGMYVRVVARRYPYQVIATRDMVIITDERTHMSRTLSTKLFNNCQPVDIVPFGDNFVLGVFSAGLYNLNPATGELAMYEGSEGLRICDVEVDPLGRVWAAATEGVYRFDKGKLERSFTSGNSCLKGGIIRVYFDHQGRGWVAGQNGMALYEPHTDKLRNDIFPPGFIDKKFVRCIAEGDDGNLLFAYDRNKLFKSDKALKHFGPIPHNLPIANVDINVLQSLPDGNWIVATSEGLFSTADFDLYKSYSPCDGVTSPHFNPSHVVDTVNNSIYMATDNSLLLTTLDKLRDYKCSSRLVISEIRVNGNSINGKDVMRTDEGWTVTVPSNIGTVDLFFTDFESTVGRPVNIEYAIDSETFSNTIPITLPVTIHRDGKSSKYVKIRLAGQQDSTITVTFDEGGSATIISYVSAIAVIILLIGTWIYIRHRRNKKNTVETTSDSPAEKPADVVDEESESDVKSAPKYRNLNIPEGELSRLSQRLELLLYDTKIYLQPDLKIGQLADKLGVSTSLLSYYFSQHLDTNYYRFLNSYRIKEFKQMVAQGAQRTYTLSAMSQMCGFSSRTSFFRYFKEAEGISPLDYIKRHEKDVS